MTDEQERDLIIEAFVSGRYGIFHNVVIHENCCIFEGTTGIIDGIQKVAFRPNEGFGLTIVNVDEHHRSCGLRQGRKECSCA